MPSASTTVTRPQPDELLIVLAGALDEPTALACESDVRMQVSLARDGSLLVLWDLRELVSYTLPARSVLVRLQSLLASKARRTVYVAERAEPRGLALWAVHMAGHWHAHLAPDLDSAYAWLRGAPEHAQSVRLLASARPPSQDVRAQAPRAPRPTPEPFDKIAG
jgi:hypothetical protein